MSFPEFERLYKTIEKLRDPEGGCPWDLEQTHGTLLKYLIEETYEYIHAVESNDSDKMEEEIGDVLLQVLLHCIIAKQDKKFTFESVSKVLADKMIRRHPHVFSDTKVSGIDDIKENWEDIKKKENSTKKGYAISDDLLNFPSLVSAYKIGKKTNKLNFDWSDPMQVSYKVEEEWQELKEELASYPRMNKERVQEELGDFLFSAAQLSRHLDIDPEMALREANIKFKRRFNQVEDLARAKNIDMSTTSQDELENLWLEVKVREKSKTKE